MKTYWDHTEKERSEMTKKEVELLLDLQLMEKGVLKVKPPIIEPVPEQPKLKQVQVFQIKEGYSATGIAFDSAERAQMFADLNPMKIDYDYAMGSQYQRAEPYKEISIMPIQVCDRAALTEAASLIKQIKAIEDANEKAYNTFSKDNEAVESCLAEVWSDYYQCQDTARQHAKVIETWNEYLKLAGNDEKVASGFLLKAIPVKQVLDSSKWTGIEIPTKFIEAKVAVEEKQPSMA